MRYSLIVVLSLITGFCFGQEPVIIKIGEEASADSTVYKPSQLILSGKLGYDFFELNDGRFIKSSIQLKNEGKIKYLIDLGYKFSTAKKSCRNNFISIMGSLYYPASIGASINIDFTLGAEVNALTDRISNKHEVFFGPATGIIFHINRNWFIHSYYKYNIVSYQKELSAGSFMFQLSYSGLIQSRRNRLPGRRWFD